MGEDRGRDAHCWTPTGWAEAVACLRLPQNVACRFPALRSSGVGSQHLVCYSFESCFHGRRFISLHRWPYLPLHGGHVAFEQFNAGRFPMWPAPKRPRSRRIGSLLGAMRSVSWACGTARLEEQINELLARNEWETLTISAIGRQS